MFNRMQPLVGLLACALLACCAGNPSPANISAGNPASYKISAGNPSPQNLDNNTTTPNERDLDVYDIRGSYRYRDAFADGAVVYVCKVLKREPSPSTLSNNSYEDGLVTLSVEQTLRGPSRKTLVLPYGFVRDGFGRGGGIPPIWQVIRGPDGKDLSGDIDLICVVIPGGIDRYANPSTGPDGAACMVMRADGVVSVFDSRRPDATKEIRALCQEYNAKDAK